MTPEGGKYTYAISLAWPLCFPPQSTTFRNLAPAGPRIIPRAKGSTTVFVSMSVDFNNRSNRFIRSLTGFSKIPLLLDLE